MFIDYKNSHLLVHEEANESFIKLKSVTTFNFCPTLVGNTYSIPFISLDKLILACKLLKYPTRFSDQLKQVHKIISQKRLTLEQIKLGNYPQTLEISDIINFLNTFEKDSGFKLTQGQRDTVVFSIYGRRVLIANEVGTGKTLVANLVLKYLLSKGWIRKALILTPAPLVRNYYEDYIKFFGKDGIVQIQKQIKIKRNEQYRKFAGFDNINFLVTNYEKCLYDYSYLRNLNIDAIVTDEFHYMKNFVEAQRSINFFEMLTKWNPKYRLTMSGTPIENKLFDLYPVFKMLDEGITLGGQKYFESNFIKFETKALKIYKNKKQILIWKTEATGFKKENLGDLKRLARPLVIRCPLLLPTKCSINDIFFTMTPKAKDAYEDIFLRETEGSAKYHACRQFLCDPTREKVTDSPKLDMLENILTQTSSKVLIFSFYKCSMKYIGDFLTSKGLKFIEVSGDTKEEATVSVNKFKADPDIKCLICTDKVNYGQNIQCAKIVINWEHPLKPTTLEQRIGRTYRTGQDTDVAVYNFCTEDTVEEIIYKNLLEKKDIINRAIKNIDSPEILEEIEGDIEEKVMKTFLSSRN